MNIFWLLVVKIGAKQKIVASMAQTDIMLLVKWKL